MSSARRRLREDLSDDEVAGGRPSARRSTQYFKEIQQQQRLSGTILAEPHVALPPRVSTTAVTPAAPATTVPAAAAAAAPTVTGLEKKQLFKGLVALAPAAFDAAGNLNVAAYTNYVKALKEDGVTAVIVNSPLAGEASALSLDERKLVASAVVSQGLPVCVHVTSGSLADSIAAARHAQEVQAVAIAVSVPSTGASLEDAIDFINEVARHVSTIPLLVWYDNASHATTFSLYALMKSIVARGLVSNIRGFVAFGGVDTADFSAAMGLKGSLTDAVYGGGNYAAATFLGATSVAGQEFSYAAPLFAKIVIAAARGDAASLSPLQSLAATLATSVTSIVGTGSRVIAAGKVLASLRSAVELGAVRPPGPRITVAEVSRLSDAMSGFVAHYTSQTKPAPAPAPKSIKAMEGYTGALNDKIIDRIAFLEPILGIRNLRSFFPHLNDKTGSWRKAYPSESNCEPAGHIDHTILKAEATRKEITTLCQEAIQNRFYAVCVNGSRVEQCLEELGGTGVKVAAVIGFPLGAGTSYAKAKEARELVQIGAHEIDMVMNIGAMKDGNYRYVYEDVKAVVDAAAPGIVKVIFETCLLQQTEIIDASILCVAAGAQFVKTSTGFNKAGATADVLDIMLAVVGNESEVKAAGGVRDFATAAAYISAGVSRIGTSSGVSIISGKPVGAGY